MALGGYADMSSTDVLAWLEGQIAAFPEKVTGDEVAAELAIRIAPILESDRAGVVDALRRLIVAPRLEARQNTDECAIREAKMWIAMEIAVNCGVVEVYLDVEAMARHAARQQDWPAYYGDLFQSVLRRLGRG
jgi:hypothetical protein